MNGTDAAKNGELRLSELAAAVGGTPEGDPEVRISGVAGLDDASPGSIVRVEHPRFLKKALASPAAALLVPPGLACEGKPCVRVEEVRRAFLRCLELFSREEAPEPGVHPTASLGAGVEVHPTSSIGPYAVLGDGVRIGARAVIHAHAVLGDGVEVGEDSIIFASAVLYPKTVVGARVRVHAGAVIGADGYGYEWIDGAHRRRPHNGRVRLGDDVEVGANTTIDRATTGETVIGPGTKIDNLVQVGHNVRTGAHCLLVSQVGIAGSATLGNGVVLGGQAGVNPHVHIGDGVRAGGRAALWSDQPAGAVLSGYPARSHREDLRIQAALGKLPELLKQVAALEKRVRELEGGESGDHE